MFLFLYTHTRTHARAYVLHALGIESGAKYSFIYISGKHGGKTHVRIYNIRELATCAQHIASEVNVHFKKADFYSNENSKRMNKP